MNTNTITLSAILIDKISKELNKPPLPELYWDYNNYISEEQVIHTFQSDRETPLIFLENELFHTNEDYITQTEKDHIRDTLEQFKEELAGELNTPIEELDLAEITEELHDDFRYTFPIDYNLKQLLAGTVNIRVEMYSNYDCINSHWLESQGAYSMDSYFGDMVRMLKLDPPAVRQMLVAKGLQVCGSWKPRSDRGCKALVRLDDFWQEMENTSCGANLLCFIAQVDKMELLKHGISGKVTFPKGNRCGIYSSCQGGGSVMEMVLQQDFTVNLSKKYDKSGYLQFALHIDNDRESGYGIYDVYGVTSKFFGNKISFT